MEQNVVDCELAERDPGLCVCKGGPTLEILKDIQRLYEERLELIDRAGGSCKLKLQVDVLRSWVGDLVGQNTLLARAVEELENEATTKLIIERRRNTERGPKQICGKVNELRIMNESLQKENLAKDREIRQLNKDAQTYEQTIMNLRKEMSLCKFHTPEVCKKDAEVMAGMCCTGTECGELVPVKDFTELLKDETMKYQERIQKMEASLKSSSDSIRALRKVNVSLSEEMHAMRRVCAALDEQCHAATLRAHFKGDIIKEMCRQLKQAKAKLKDSSELVSPKSKDYVSGDAECPHGSSVSYDSVTIACVRAQPRRKRHVPPREPALLPADLRAQPGLHDDSLNLD
ncbi:uncharacterized protein LOC113501268 [Trichoplusia ni]|uniref:Uncharacterized protein LOC113501268 n=1 Tax=Trichoplusia ni TaxID=7111 RepID=A0A7E5WBQ9_TRINI|nr:uncharacterized protein LOC113501268 [Trichoplusia ni]